MARLLLLTHDLAPSAQVVPGLGLLGHRVRTLPPDASVLLDSPDADVVLVDARQDLVQARALCRVIRATGTSRPVIAVLTEGGLAAVNADWAVEDVLLESAGPAEIEARLRLATTRSAGPDEEDVLLESAGPAEIEARLRLATTRSTGPDEEDGRIVAGDLIIDEESYSARVGSEVLNLTYKEFELLKHLAQHPGRVFTRAQLLHEVWGYDYYGGIRTVDVHVRRLRAKLGSEHEQLIGTVRNVGYRFVPVRDEGVDTTDGAEVPA